MRRIWNLPSPFTCRRERACFGVVWKCEYVFLYFFSNLSAKGTEIINISTNNFYKVCVRVIFTKIFGFVLYLLVIRDVLTIPPSTLFAKVFEIRRDGVAWLSGPSRPQPSPSHRKRRMLKGTKENYGYDYMQRNYLTWHRNAKLPLRSFC